MANIVIPDPDRMRAHLLANIEADEDGCWIWQLGKTVRGGYAQVYIPSGPTKMGRGHKMAYQLWVGDVPDGQVVAHRCDKPPCIRPECLFITDQDGNLADMRAKGRGFRKLTDDEVLAIRAQWTGQRGQLAELGRRYGVSPRAIQYVVDGEHYIHVKPLPGSYLLPTC